MANVYNYVFSNILNKMKESENDNKPFRWVSPWNGYDCAKNYVTLRDYNGINIITLEPGEYITMKQFNILNSYNTLMIPKGTKMKHVYFFKPYRNSDKDKDTDRDTDKIIFLFKYYNVFNVDDIIGLYPKTKSSLECEVDTIISKVNDDVETFSKLHNITYEYKDSIDQSTFDDATGTLYVPSINKFSNCYDYCNDIFHTVVNIILYTTKQLKRKDGAYYNLICEIGSQLICRFYGVPDLRDSANTEYIKEWMGYINTKSGKSLVIAASLAKKTFDYFCDDMKLFKADDTFEEDASILYDLDPADFNLANPISNPIANPNNLANPIANPNNTFTGNPFTELNEKLKRLNSN